MQSPGPFLEPFVPLSLHEGIFHSPHPLRALSLKLGEGFVSHEVQRFTELLIQSCSFTLEELEYDLPWISQ